MMRRANTRCPAEHTLVLIGGRWKVMILYHLDPGLRRFSELRRLMPPVTPRMLAQQLRQLERDGLVRRKIYAEIPPRVEYSLTSAGKSLKPVIAAMCRWAMCNPRSCSPAFGRK